MQINNSARLSYNGITLTSNTVTGEVLSPLTVIKNASSEGYRNDASIGYTVSIVNTSDTAYQNLTLVDNLGEYAFGAATRFPLIYNDNTAVLQYYGANGITQGTVTAADIAGGESFTFDLPPKTTAILSYFVTATVFAPLSAGSEITNTVTLTGNGITAPITAQNTLSALLATDLVISKFGCDTAVAGSEYTYTIIVSNYGNIAVTNADFLSVSDTISPALSNVTVYSDGVLWTQGVQYNYDEASAYFQTVYGAITLPPASFSVDSFGRWLVSPSSTVITITGTVA